MSRIFMSIDEAAMRLGVPVPHVKRLGELGMLQEFRNADALLYKTEEILDCVDRPVPGFKLSPAQLRTIKVVLSLPERLPRWVIDQLEHRDWSSHPVGDMSTMLRDLQELAVIMEPGLNQRKGWMLPYFSIGFTARVLDSICCFHIMSQLIKVPKRYESFESTVCTIPKVRDEISRKTSLGRLLKSSEELALKLRARRAPEI